MSSIPLPALDVKTPQQPDVMGQMGNLMRLKAMQQQIAEQPLREQALQQQLQTGQLQNQQLQRQAASQQAMMDAYSSADGNLSKAYDLAATSGKVLPIDLVKLRQAGIQMQQQALGLLQARGQRAIQDGDLMAGAVDAVNQAPEQDRPAVYAQQRTQLANAGVDVSRTPPVYPGDAQFKSLWLGVQSHKAALQQALQVAQTQEADAKKNQIVQQTQFGPTGPAAQSKYRFILGKLAAHQPVSPQDVAWARAFEDSQAKTSSTSDDIGIKTSNFSKPAGLASVGIGRSGSSRATGTDGGSSTSHSAPNALQQTVDAIGDYSLDPRTMSRIFYSHPGIIGDVRAKFPNWDETNYVAKNKIVQNYTSGPESRSINAIGTALGHANELRDAIDALGSGNGGLNTLRSIGQKIGVETGSNPVTAFNLIVHRLAPEITQAYVQGGGGEGERAANADDFSASMSHQQLVKNWSETMKLLQSKIAQQKQQWDTTYMPHTPQEQFYTRFMSPVAKQAIERWETETGNKSAIGGAATSALTVTAPNGKTYTFKDAASANAFKKEAGIQ